MSTNPFPPVEKVEVMTEPTVKDDDVSAFLKSESGASYELINEHPSKIPTPNCIHATEKAKKDRNRRASVNLREDVRNVLEGLTYHPLESVDLLDRPGPSFEGLVFNKYGVATNQKQLASNLNISQLWRACSRHYLITSEESEGSKGRRKIHTSFDKFRHTQISQVNPKLCACMFKDVVEVQWNLRWGAHCRQCFGKAENQDGWAVVMPQERLDKGDYLSDHNGGASATADRSSGSTIRYCGFTNFHAEMQCRDHPASVPIPMADVTRLGDTASIAHSNQMHQLNLTVSNHDMHGSHTKKRRASIQAIRRILGGGDKKTNDERSIIDLASTIPPETLSASLYSSQGAAEPLDVDEEIPQTFHADWRMTDTAANFPNVVYNEKGQYDFDVDGLANHPGAIINPIQPGLLCILDGHGNGGKLGVARAATTIAEALTLAMSNVSWLATHLGVKTENLTDLLNSELETGVQDNMVGNQEDFIFGELGNTINLKSSLCSCSIDKQLLFHGLSCVGNPSLVQSDKENVDKATDQTGTVQPVCFQRSVLETTRQLIVNLLSVTIRLAHSRILHENDCLNRDFGATCTTMLICGRYLFASWVGDSPGCLIAIKGNKFGAIRLTNEHSLYNLNEQRRIEDFVGPGDLEEQDAKRRARRHSRGHIIETQNAGERLIPSHMPYAESRNRGLSINMSRAIGHNKLTYCGLSPQPEFATLDILYALPRMKWCTGPKFPESIPSDKNRSFLNTNTHSAVALGTASLEECSSLMHIKPEPSVSAPFRQTDNPYRVAPSGEMISAFKDLEIYVCAYSDGVGDCMNPCDVGAEIYLKRALPCQDIATHLTAKAEEVRQLAANIGKDNCVVVLSKMTLSSVLPVMDD
eukprot:GHVH01003892.1.p1 GENE.GHVH01003892.1~~GHVH01003892.1.p1  ORF type:complete len:869 (+),score=105.09 GHVH01003892.1:110-2716(+)